MSLLRYFTSTKEDRGEPSPKRVCIEPQQLESELEAETSHFSESELDSTSTRSTSSASSSSSSKQSRRFNCEWLAGRRHWLDYKPDQGMFCLLCKKYNKRPFNNGIWNSQPCICLRLQSIIIHERSAAHLDSVKLEAASKASENVVSALNRPISAKGIEQAFLCLYFLAKQRIPHTTNYVPLLDLAGLLGVDVKSKISIARNATYSSDKTIQEMVHILSDVIEDKF